MQDKRDAGVPRDKLSEDETMQKSFVGNVYRELDRGSVRVKEEVIGVGDQGVEEVCCECRVSPVTCQGISTIIPQWEFYSVSRASLQPN